MTLAESEDLFLDPEKERIAERLRQLTPDQRADLIRLSRPRIVEPYFKHIPHPPQQVFLSLQMREAMYGGAAGGGKSDALLMAALQYVDVPGYSALILRRTWPDLNSPGAILDRAKTWFAGTDAIARDGGRQWFFPGGGRIQFGYMQHDKDKYKFQSAEYQFIGFDELTQFEESLYTYLFSRCRRPAMSCLNCGTSVKRYRSKTGGAYWKHTNRSVRGKCPKVFPDPAQIKQYGPSIQDGMRLWDVPLRVRSATNPGGIGHLWVRDRFIDERTKRDGSVFVPARLTDNPSLDRTEYEKSLEHLLPLDRERLLNGDWDVMEEGGFFERHNFLPIEPKMIPQHAERCRFWDMAATDDDGDFTVGALLAFHDGRWFLEHINRFQKGPADVEKAILHQAHIDKAQYGNRVFIRMEQEPGSSGKTVISHYRRNILYGFDFDGQPSSGKKTDRALPMASAVAAQEFYIALGDWNRDFLDEAALFPRGQHDDQIDGCSGAMEQIAFGSRSRLVV